MEKARGRGNEKGTLQAAANKRDIWHKINVPQYYDQKRLIVKIVKPVLIKNHGIQVKYINRCLKEFKPRKNRPYTIKV